MTIASLHLYTPQVDPEESSGAGATRSVLHATPLRASRALALRHVMRAFHFTMSNAVFLCTPAAVAHKGEQGPGTVLGTLTSDLVNLIEGAQRVVVVPPRTELNLTKTMRDSSGSGVRARVCAAGVSQPVEAPCCIANCAPV
jgi:hypothetical protein